jgi:hypothetical protein
MKQYIVTEEQYEYLHALLMEKTKFRYNDAEYLRLEAMRNHAVAILESIHIPELPACPDCAAKDAEIERLRYGYITTYGPDGYAVCLYCGHESRYRDSIEHKNDCILRAALKGGE